MSRAAEGSPEWFANCRREVNDHIRALDCFERAAQNIDRMLRDWDTLDDELQQGALFDFAIIRYARPFLKNQDGRAYAIKHLKSHPGFDRELHGHICDLRNKLVAHHDNDVLRGRARHEYVDVDIDGVKSSILIGTVGSVKALHRINNRSAAERYASHLHACVTCVRAVAEERLTALHSAALLHPAHARAGTVIGAIGSIPAAPSLQAELPSTFDQRFPGIPDPTFPLPPDAYVYQEVALTRREFGPFPVDTPAGRGHIELTDGAREGVPIATFRVADGDPDDTVRVPDQQGRTHDGVG